MFSIGASEPLASPALVRHSIVWLGEPYGESSQGLSATHPICRVVSRIVETMSVVGAWLACREVSRMREFERKALLSRLVGAEWTIDPDQSAVIRAHKRVSISSIWPYGTGPALPWPQSEILVVGCLVEYPAITCCKGSIGESQQAVRGDGLVLQSDLAGLLVARQGCAISVGRTHTENSPGLSIIAPAGEFDPLGCLDNHDVASVHVGMDAARAWSYGRIVRN